MVISYKGGKFPKMSETYTQSKQKQCFIGLNILVGIFPQCETNACFPHEGTKKMSKS